MIFLLFTLLLILLMHASQGLIGWWMVRSGLGDAAKKDGEGRKEIRVSPYRLATHLGMAFLTFSGLLWTGVLE